MTLSLVTYIHTHTHTSIFMYASVSTYGFSGNLYHMCVCMKMNLMCGCSYLGILSLI